MTEKLSLHIAMLSLVLVILAPLVSALVLPEVDLSGIPPHILANETQLYPPYTYVLPSSYIPEAQ
jgi:hypothetical protein